MLPLRHKGIHDQVDGGKRSLGTLHRRQVGDLQNGYERAACIKVLPVIHVDLETTIGMHGLACQWHLLYIFKLTLGEQWKVVTLLRGTCKWAKPLVIDT